MTKSQYKVILSTKASIDNDVISKYNKLQFVLFIVHYACALAIVIIDRLHTEDSFKVDYNFRYNLWDTNGDETCESGCTLTEETYTFPEKLNINVLVSFFSFVSGTNHLIQFFFSSEIFGFRSVFENWIETGYIWVRSIDFGVSAGLMLLANSILFYAPPDVQTLVLFFLFQALTQLGGYASEAFLVNNNDELSKNLFWVSGLLYLIPWSLRFGMFFLTVKFEALGVGVESNTPPIQVWFFLGWIFQTFMLFPLAHWNKMHEDTPQDENVVMKYEIIYSLLSFLAKLPLLSVFIGGSFQRELFTEIVDDDTTTIPTTAAPGSFDANTYLALFLPMGLSLLGSAVIVYFFWNELQLEDNGRFNNFKQVGFIAAKCSIYVLLTTFTTFIPILIGLAPDVNATAVIFMTLTIPAALATIAWQVDLRR